MIIKSLYESLVNCLNEARVQRTIDKKLWLSIASTCSRNKAAEAENIKPRPTQTKEQLLPRYVAALLIMKKQCPENEQDINDIKTFKLVGRRLLELGCTIEEIKQEYINNGGKLVTNTVNVNPQQSTQVNQKLNQEVNKEDQVKVNKTKELKKEKSKVQKQLPPGIKSYDEVYDFVKRSYNDLNEICSEIYDILDMTYFTLKKSFYKIEDSKYKLYFRDVTTDENQKLYFNDKHCIYITWIKTIKRKVVEGTFCILTNNMTINDEPIGNIIQLDDNTVITKQQLYEICVTILAKLRYASQSNYNNPLLPKIKEKTTSFGTFGNKTRDFNSIVNEGEFEKILPFVIKKYSSIAKCKDILELFLYKEKMGNTHNGISLELKEPIYTGKFFNEQKTFDIMGYAYNNYAQFIVRYKEDGKYTTQIIPAWRAREYGEPTGFGGQGYQIQHRVDMKELQKALWYIIAVLLYYRNNYSNVVK